MKIKSYLLSLLVITSVLGLFAGTGKVYAVNVLNTGSNCSVNGGDCGACNNTDATSKPAICGDNNTNGKNPLFGPNSIATDVVRVLSLFIGVLAVIFIVVQAIRLSASGGSPEETESAKRGIIYAAAGLLVAVLAQALVAFVLNKVN